MLLAIDVGNTNIVLGVFDGARLAESWRLATMRERTSDEVGILVTHLFARSGIATRWRAEDQSLLELAEACDVPVRWSCRTGVCHNCETTLIAGRVDYSPDPVEAPADGSALICCSRPHHDVVLDL